MEKEQTVSASCSGTREPVDRIGWISLLAYVALCGLLILTRQL